MTFNEQMEALERLHLLIKRKATGTPEQLTEKFGVSLGTINNFIRFLRDKGLPVAYNRAKKTYYYEYDIDILFFQIITNKV